MTIRCLAAAALVIAFTLPAAARQAPADAPDLEQPRAITPEPQQLHGARLDVSGFRHRRPLADEGEGLVTLKLDAAVLAHSRGRSGRFADLRIVDQTGRQIPYLLKRRDDPLILDLQPHPIVPQAAVLRDEGGRRSTYAIALPYSGLPRLQLELHTSERVFKRAVSVGVERPPDRRRREAWFDVLASGVWQGAGEGAAAPPLTLGVIVPGDAAELILAIEDGDNRQLPLTAARALLPSWELRFFKPPGTLELAYGREDLDTPEYDLALLAPAVLDADAREITAAPAAVPRATAEPGMHPWIFGIGLALAALVLLALIVRLLSSPDAG